MANKQQPLSEGERNMLHTHGAEWQAKALACSRLGGPARARLSRALARLYAAADIPFHDNVVVAKCPLAARLAFATISGRLERLAREGALRTTPAQQRSRALTAYGWALRQAGGTLLRDLPADVSAVWLQVRIGALVGALATVAWGSFGDYFVALLGFIHAGGAWSVVGALLGIGGGMLVALLGLGLLVVAESSGLAIAVGPPLLVMSSYYTAKWSLLGAAWLAGRALSPLPAFTWLTYFKTLLLAAALSAAATAMVSGSRLLLGRARAARQVFVLTSGQDPSARRIRAVVLGATDRRIARAVGPEVRNQVREGVTQAIVDVASQVHHELNQRTLLLQRQLAGEASAGEHGAQSQSPTSLRTLIEEAERLVRRALALCITGPIDLTVGQLDSTSLARDPGPPLAGACAVGDTGWLLWFRGRVDHVVDPVGWQNIEDLAELCLTGGCWAHRDFAIVVQPPTELHVEHVDATPVLHRAEGPAVVWPGLVLTYSHGLRIDEAVFERAWTPDELAGHHVRAEQRAVIERIGWPVYCRQAGLMLIAEASDPGNPGCSLRLYDPPRACRGVRILVSTNGSPEEQGFYAEFGELVPDFFTDPVSAVAWAYDCAPAEYARLERRT